MEVLKKYIIALTNLYGFVHKNKVLQVYNAQNEAQLKLKDINPLFDKASQELKSNFVETYRDYFVHESILDFNEFDILSSRKQNKPHYVPMKNELLKYCDDLYFEKSKEYKILLKYVKNQFFKEDQERAEQLVEIVYESFEEGEGLDMALSVFETFNISFRDQKQVEKVLQLLALLNNATRTWENNGHTPNELNHLKPSTEQNYLRTPDDAYEHKDEIEEINYENIGRNDRCPCGSGKKYKMCCLKKFN